MSGTGEQIPLNFDRLVIEPYEPEVKPEPETDHSENPGAIWNRKIGASDGDIPF